MEAVLTSASGCVEEEEEEEANFASSEFASSSTSLSAVSFAELDAKSFPSGLDLLSAKLAIAYPYSPPRTTLPFPLASAPLTLAAPFPAAPFPAADFPAAPFPAPA